MKKIMNRINREKRSSAGEACMLSKKEAMGRFPAKPFLEEDTYLACLPLNNRFIYNIHYNLRKKHLFFIFLT